jgi:hypothetical protein
MEKLRQRLDELKRRKELAQLITSYKRKYAECRPECVHLLIHSYSQNHDFINLFEEYLFCPSKYNVETVEKELKETSYKYVSLLHDALFESGDPTTYDV